MTALLAACLAPGCDAAGKRMRCWGRVTFPAQFSCTGAGGAEGQVLTRCCEVWAQTSGRGTQSKTRCWDGPVAVEHPLSRVSAFPKYSMLLPGRNNPFPVLSRGIPGVFRLISLPLDILRVLLLLDASSTLHYESWTHGQRCPRVGVPRCVRTAKHISQLMPQGSLTPGRLRE